MLCCIAYNTKKCNIAHCIHRNTMHLKYRYCFNAQWCLGGCGGGGGGGKKDLAGRVHLLSSTLYVHNMPSLIRMLMITILCLMMMMMMMNVKRARLVHFLVWRNPRQEGIRDKSEAWNLLLHKPQYVQHHHHHDLHNGVTMWQWWWCWWWWWCVY